MGSWTIADPPGKTIIASGARTTVNLQRTGANRAMTFAKASLAKCTEYLTSDHRVAGSSPTGYNLNRINYLQINFTPEIRRFSLRY